MSGSSSRLRPYRLAAFAVSIALLVGVAGAMLWSIRGFTRSTELVAHSYQVTATTEAIRSATRAAESNARGLRLSGREEMRREYEAIRPLIQQQSARLIALTSDDPRQHQRALELQRAVSERMDGIADMVLVQRLDGIDRVRNLSRSGRGYEQMQRINQITDRILAEEQSLLRARSAATARQARAVTAVVVVGTVLPLVLLAIMLSSLIRENRRSRILEQGAREAVRGLEESLAYRDRLSEQRRILGVYAGLLQTCQSIEEALRVTAQVVADLMPDASGCCYVLRPSQGVATTAMTFGTLALACDDQLDPEHCWALRRAQSHRTGGPHGRVLCEHVHADRNQADDTWTLCVPLMAQGTQLGLLHFSGYGNGDRAADTSAAEAVAEQLSLAMMNLQLRETLRLQSLRDVLTGLYNRRYLVENLPRELQRCERRRQPLSLIMLDVDHFKRFNDRNGHTAGDALLAGVGQTLQRLTRSEDIACRYGGEEFILVLPETDRETALLRAEEIRRAVAATTVMHRNRTLGPTTASLGIATFPYDGDAAISLIECADAALYRAKAAGRDNVVEASPQPQPQP